MVMQPISWDPCPRMWALTKRLRIEQKLSVATSVKCEGMATT